MFILHFFYMVKILFFDMMKIEKKKKNRKLSLHEDAL